MSAEYWLVVPAAGAGRRSGAAVPKQYNYLAGRRMLEWSLRPFAADERCRGLAIAFSSGDELGPSLVNSLSFRTTIFTLGGVERCHSVLNALTALQPQASANDWVLVHDAARPCITRAEIDALIVACVGADHGGLLALPVSDSLKRASGQRVSMTEPRAGLWRAQTPQMFRLGELATALRVALASGRSPGDEAEAMETSGMQPLLVAGAASNIKVTQPGDFALAAQALALGENARAGIIMRTGFGTDIHAFGPGDHVMLGGVRVPHDRGVIAHSDGDVLLHALCDALLGAAGLGDIGVHFPDSDPALRGVASAGLLSETLRRVAERGWRPVNADLTLLAEAPRIGPHRTAIVSRVSSLLGLPVDAVNVKATTCEGLGFIGRRDGLLAQAVVTLTAL